MIHVTICEKRSTHSLPNYTRNIFHWLRFFICILLAVSFLSSFFPASLSNSSHPAFFVSPSAWFSLSFISILSLASQVTEISALSSLPHQFHSFFSQPTTFKLKISIFRWIIQSAYTASTCLCNWFFLLFCCFLYSNYASTNKKSIGKNIRPKRTLLRFPLSLVSHNTSMPSK